MNGTLVLLLLFTELHLKITLMHQGVNISHPFGHVARRDRIVREEMRVRAAILEVAYHYYHDKFTM